MSDKAKECGKVDFSEIPEKVSDVTVLSAEAKLCCAGGVIH